MRRSTASLMPSLERLTSRQEALLRAIQQGRLDLIERRKRMRAARKSKKRRKKKLPRTRRLPRQWHVRCAGFAGYDAPRVMFPSVVARPRMLRIMASMDQKDSTLRALIVDSSSGTCRAGFAWYCASRCFPFCTWQSQMLRIVAGMNQKDSSEAAHQGHFHPCRGAEAFPHGPDCAADHRGSPVAPGQGGQCPDYTGLQVVKIPVVAQRQFPLVFQTMDIPQLLDTVIDVPVVQVVQLPGSFTSHGAEFVFDKVIDVPLCRSCLSCPLLLTTVQTADFRGGAAVADPAW